MLHTLYINTSPKEYHKYKEVILAYTYKFLRGEKQDTAAKQNWLKRGIKKK